MRRTLRAALLALALAVPAPALAANVTSTGAVTTVPTVTTIVKGAGSTLTTVVQSPKPRHESSGVSTGAAIVAVIAALLALGCLVWAVFRFGAFEPHWLLSARHSLGEAGYRSSATWAEFRDWLRLGH